MPAVLANTTTYNFSGPIFWIPGLIGLALVIWSLVDLFRRPDWVWQASGQNKTLWIVLLIVGICICSIVVGLIYLLAIKPKLDRVENAGPPSGGFPPYGGGYPPPGGPGGYPPPPGGGGYPPPPGGGGYPPPPGGGYPPPPAPPGNPGGYPPPPPGGGSGGYPPPPTG